MYFKQVVQGDREIMNAPHVYITFSLQIPPHNLADGWWLNMVPVPPYHYYALGNHHRRGTKKHIILVNPAAVDALVSLTLEHLQLQGWQNHHPNSYHQMSILNPYNDIIYYHNGASIRSFTSVHPSHPLAESQLRCLCYKSVWPSPRQDPCSIPTWLHIHIPCGVFLMKKIIIQIIIVALFCKEHWLHGCVGINSCWHCGMNSQQKTWIMEKLKIIIIRSKQGQSHIASGNTPIHGDGLQLQVVNLNDLKPLLAIQYYIQGSMKSKVK